MHFFAPALCYPFLLFLCSHCSLVHSFPAFPVHVHDPLTQHQSMFEPPLQYLYSQCRSLQNDKIILITSFAYCEGSSDRFWFDFLKKITVFSGSDWNWKLTVVRKYNIWVAFEAQGKNDSDVQCMCSLKKKSFDRHRNRVLFSLMMTFGPVVSVARLLPVDRPNSFF